MRRSLLPNNRAYWLSSALLLAACGGELPAPTPAPAEGSLVDPCAGAYVFAVDGEKLTLLSTNTQTFYSDDADVRWSSGGGVRPGAETRALVRMSAKGYSGEVELTWDGDLLETVKIDAAFLNAGGTETRLHPVANGPLLELHVVSRAACPSVAFELSRTELEALDI